MVVTTYMFHKMNASEPKISDMERIDLELRNKTDSDISVQKKIEMTN